MAHGGSGTDARTELPARTSIMDVIKAVMGVDHVFAMIWIGRE